METTSRRALISVARHWRALDAEARALQADIKLILDELAAQLLAHHGVGLRHRQPAPDRSGRQPSPPGPRTQLRRALRFLTGRRVMGRTNRHRLNRGSDRQANSALWAIVLVRMATRPKSYVR